MTVRALIAHGGPQRYPTRAAPSLMGALRDARGSPQWTPWTILCRLTGTTGLMQPLLVSTVQIAATLSPTVRPRHRVTTITGIRDHLRPEWLITITGIRSVQRLYRCQTDWRALRRAKPRQAVPAEFEAPPAGHQMAVIRQPPPAKKISQPSQKMPPNSRR